MHKLTFASQPNTTKTSIGTIIFLIIKFIDETIMCVEYAHHF